MIGEGISRHELKFRYVGSARDGTKKYHFEVCGSPGENFFFYTFGDMSGYGLSGKIAYSPSEYIFIGAFLLSFKEEIRELINEHKKDEVNRFDDKVGR